MKKLLALAILCAPLGACGFVQDAGNAISVVTGSSVSAQQVSVAASTFDALENAGAAYLGLPLCGPTNTSATPVCRTSATSSAIYKYLIQGRQARNQLEAQVASSGTGSVSIFNTLMTAVNALQPLLPSSK